MQNVDPVILKLEADLADYRRDLTQAQRLTDTKLDAIEKRGEAMGQGLKRGFSLAKAAAVGFVASIGVEAITRAISSGLEYASSLGEVAQQLGVSTNALQEYRYAASQAGLSSEEMDQALGQLTRRIGEAASGTKAQAEAFQKLGISVKDANGDVIDAGDAIPRIADALRGVESPAERAAILMDLFGRSGQKLEPLLAGGAGAVNELRDAAHKLGIVLSEEQIQNADDTADKLSAVQQVLQARIAGVVADNAKEITELANSLADLADKAIKAAAEWVKFRNAQSKVSAEYKVADAYLAGRKDLTPEQRKQAGAAARLKIDQRNGIQTDSTSYLGGLFTIRKQSMKGQNANLGGGFNVGQGSPIYDFAPGQGVKGGLKAIGGGDNPFSAAITAANDMTLELQRLTADLALAQADVSGNLSARAAAEKQRIQADLAADIARTRADKDLSKADQDRLVVVQQQIAAERERLVDVELAKDEARQQREADQEATRAKLEALGLEIAALDAEADAAELTSDRRDIERRLLDLQQEEERARLDAAIAAGQIADAAKARASLSRKQAAERKGLAQDQQGPGARYLSDLRKDADQLNEAYQNVAVDGLKSLNDGLVDAIMGSKSLGDVFKSVANQIVADLLRIAVQRAVITPLANAIFGNSSGGAGIAAGAASMGLQGTGGIFGSPGGILGGVLTGLGGLFGRASGGYVAPGQMVRVNESAPTGRVEGFMPTGGGRIIPLGQMNTLAQGGGGQGDGVVTVRLDLSGDIDARIQQVSAGVAVEVVRSSAPALIDASSKATMARAGRMRI